jgi:hypothetical protein
MKKLDDLLGKLADSIAIILFIAFILYLSYKLHIYFYKQVAIDVLRELHKVNN